MASRREQQGDVEDRYRHVRHHPVFGRRGSESRWGAADRRGRGAGSGPRLVRPVAPVAQVRPAEPERPSVDAAGVERARLDAVPVGGLAGVLPPSSGGRARPVWSAGHSAAPRPGRAVGERGRRPSRARIMLRRAVALVALVVTTALTVVALGLVADAVSAARQPAAPATVTVEAPGAGSGASH